MCLGVRGVQGLKLAMADVLVIRSKASRSQPRRKVQHSHLSRRPSLTGHLHTKCFPYQHASRFGLPALFTSAIKVPCYVFQLFVFHGHLPQKLRSQSTALARLATISGGALGTDRGLQIDENVSYSTFGECGHRSDSLRGRGGKATASSTEPLAQWRTRHPHAALGS
jgi:hypothetical protein